MDQSDSDSTPPEDLRVQAVFALFRSDPAAKVSEHYGIDRSSLYKFRSRALSAIRDALKDQPRGPKRPHNLVSDALEEETISLCQLPAILQFLSDCETAWPQSSTPSHDSADQEALSPGAPYQTSAAARFQSAGTGTQAQSQA